MEGDTNNGLNFRTLDSYRQVLEKLGVPELLRLDPEENRKALFENYAFKAIFYSDEGLDAHKLSTATLYQNEKLIQKEGRLGDKTLQRQLPSVIEALFELENREITVPDVVSLRELLIKNLFGNSKYASGLRRYRNSVGDAFITGPSENVEAELKQNLKRLNKKHDNITNSFLEDVLFMSEFIKIHPFEDTDGRVARLLYNWYALSHGFRAIQITKPLRNAHINCLNPFHYSNYVGGSAAATLLLSLSPPRMEKLMKNLEKAETDSPYMLEIKTQLKLYVNQDLNNGKKLGTQEEKRIREIAESLYAKGSAEDPHFKYAGLWIATYAGVDTPIIKRAYAEGGHDSKLRTLAIASMGKTNYPKYKEDIMAALVHDGSEDVRMQAVIQIGNNKDLNHEIANGIINRNETQGLLVVLGKYYTKAKPEGAFSVETARRLMEYPDKDVKVRGFQAFIAHADESQILEALQKRLPLEDSLVKKETVVELKRHNKINLPMVAEELTKMAETDEAIRVPLLGELSLLQKMSPSYMPLMENILDSGAKYSEAERHYAIYLLGREIGSDELYEKYASKIDMKSDLERLALLNVHTDSLEKLAKDQLEPRYDIPRLIFPNGRTELEQITVLEQNIMRLKMGMPLNLNPDERSNAALTEAARDSKGNGVFRQIIMGLSEFLYDAQQRKATESVAVPLAETVRKPGNPTRIKT